MFQLSICTFRAKHGRNGHRFAASQGEIRRPWTRRTARGPRPPRRTAKLFPLPPNWEILLESRHLALVAAGASWLALVIPVYFSSRIDLLEWQRQAARPARRAGWQRLYLDVVLLAFGGFVYWQLTESGSFILRRVGSDQFPDPILLLGPSLLLIAVALIFLRLFPYVLRLATWVAKGARGLVLTLGLARLSRDPRGPGLMVWRKLR